MNTTNNISDINIDVSINENTLVKDDHISYLTAENSGITYKRVSPLLLFLLSLPIIIGLIAVAFTSYAYISSDFTKKEIEAAVFTTFEDAGKYDGRAVLKDMFPFMERLLTALDNIGDSGKTLADELADSAILDVNPFSEPFKMTSITISEMDTGSDEALQHMKSLISITEKQFEVDLGGETAYDMTDIKYCSGTAVASKDNASVSFEFEAVLIKCNDKWFVSGINPDNSKSDNSFINLTNLTATQELSPVFVILAP